MKDVLGIIISFDNANDLRGMSEHRTVAAVPFGGRYRIVDFMLSNMVNSGITDVGLLMRDKYQSLIDHVGSGKDWDLSRKRGGLTLLPPYSYSKKASPLITGELRGKVDALAGIVDLINKSKAEYIVVADGDIIANIELDDVIQKHAKSNVDMTVVCIKNANKSPYNTYIKVGENNIIEDIRTGDDGGKCSHTALGIYVLRKEMLIELLAECVTHNLKHFEHEALQLMLENNTMQAYLFDNYAVKIEDVKGYFSANMDLLDKDVRDDLFLKNRPILTRVHDESPAYYGDESKISNTLIADGVSIEGDVDNCIIFRDVHIEKGAVVKNCIIMQGSKIMSDSSLNSIITDKGVVIRQGRTMVGHGSYPVVVEKNSIV